MRFVLAANTMEHPGFPGFARDALAAHPDAALVICGDLLNIFPEPGEDLRGSIFYQLYGEFIVEEMEILRANQFATVHTSRFIELLRELFTVGGKTHALGTSLASHRYDLVF